MDWTVHKFGGTSLADADRVRHVARVIRQQSMPSAVVVSAMGDTTDDLLALVEQTESAEAYRATLDAIRETQATLASDLMPKGRVEAAVQRIEEDVRDMDDVLRAAHLMNSVPDTARDLIAGYGELWSARLLAGYLAAQGVSVDVLNARDVLVVSHGKLGPVVDWETTRARFAEWQSGRDAEVVIITGFIAVTPDGAPTTLGRNGSDFSAAIFAALLEASALHIWTDVDGVMSADPRHVPDARRLNALSYHEAMELAYFGARVIHPSTLAPAFERSIPIHIRNTFNAAHTGTRIHLEGETDRPVKGFATVGEIALLNLEGSGMIGVPGIARRLFSALEDEGVSVIMISQGSSEHSICFAVPQGQAEVAREAAEQAFFAEMHQGRIQSIDVTRDCSILAVVGDRMSGTPGIAATFFGALSKAGVNVRAIAQGASERNISAVVDGKDATKALRAAHAGFYLSNQTLSVGVIGPGNVGGVLLDQLAEQAETLRDEHMIDLRVRGITNTRRMVLDEQQVDLDHWQTALVDDGEEADLERFVDHIQTDYHPHAVIVDCTSSQAVARRYADWLERGIHVVTPNKKANTAAWASYQRLRDLSRAPQPRYLYETTVGAGLPIIQTLRNLIETGDRVLQIEGILSGTLSYLFNAFDGERPFSEILREAKENGFTEPDPREDLSGMDVARKVVILGREMGLQIELDDVEVESLVPDELEDGSIEMFMERLPDYDERMTNILREARAEGQVLRFVGAVDHEGNASVKLRRYAGDHSFARIHRTDNIVQFRTRRYHENPLIVQGPGAGPDVTAAGVFADLLRLVA